MKSHFLKENDVVLSSRWQFQDGRSKGMGTEWDQEPRGLQRVEALLGGLLRENIPVLAHSHHPSKMYTLK